VPHRLHLQQLCCSSVVQQAADLIAAAIRAWAANDTVAGSSYKLQSDQRHQLADNLASVERFTEVRRHARMHCQRL
jgi:hypothetical protein